MTIHLPENLENGVREMVHSGQFASVDEAMAEATRLLLEQQKRGNPGTRAAPVCEEDILQTKKPVWEDILDLTAEISDDEFDKLPGDGAEQHDHYIYGTSKRTPAP